MGVPHPIYGESVEACVTCFDNSLFNADEIRETLKKTLARFKVPSHIFLYDKFPMTTNNKIDLRALRTQVIAKIHEMRINEKLEQGEEIFHVTLKNTVYNIDPIVSMIEKIAVEIEYNSTRISAICLCVREFLTERITNSYEDVGNIEIKVLFYQGHMRILFTDNGAEFDFHKNEKTNSSAHRILTNVDAVDTISVGKKKYYAMDFLYEKDFSIREFLLKHDRED